jgi:hypothetical protein
MEPFYLTLTSKKEGHYTKNNAGKFRAHLSAPLSLTGRWEIGLAELHMPCTLYTTKKTKIEKTKDGVQDIIETDGADPPINLLAIHCDLLKDQLEDDAHNRIIRTVNIKSAGYKENTIQTFSFGRIYYYPVSRGHISDILFYITTEKGLQATFLSGTLAVLLHFRPSRDEL